MKRSSRKLRALTSLNEHITSSLFSPSSRRHALSLPETSNSKLFSPSMPCPRTVALLPYVHDLTSSNLLLYASFFRTSNPTYMVKTSLIPGSIDRILRLDDTRISPYLSCITPFSYYLVLRLSKAPTSVNNRCRLYLSFDWNHLVLVHDRNFPGGRVSASRFGSR